LNPLTCASIYLSLTVSAVLPIFVAPTITQSVQAQTTETILYVDANTGNDETASGTRDSPYQTLTQAIAAAPANAVIQLANGTYSEDTGETFPIVVKKPLEIRGHPSSQGYQVKIQGGGEFYSPTGAGQSVAIALLEDSTLTGVSVTNQRDRGIGVWIEGASPTLIKNTFERNDNTGVAVNGKGAAVIQDNYFYSNSGNGMVIYGQSQPTVENNTFERTGFGISITQEASPELIGNEIKHNRIGVMVEGNAQPILRENLIALSTEDGLVAITNSRPNLGTSDAPGGNIFRSNRGQAIKNLTKTYTIPASGNQIAGETTGQIDLSATVAETAPIPRDPLPLAETPNQDPSTNESNAAETAPIPLNRNLSPLPATSNQGTATNESDSDSSSRELVWTAPNYVPSANSGSNRPLPPLNPSLSSSPSESQQVLPPSQPLSFDPPPPESVPRNTASNENNATTNASSNRSSGRSLEELLVLEPNASPSNSSPRRNANSLPVPSGNIPTGQPFRPGASPEERVTAVGGQYRVIVEITQASDKRRVQEIVPQAFASRYQGRPVMQVGIFRTTANAEEIRQKLRQAGLQAQIIAVSNDQ